MANNVRDPVLMACAYHEAGHVVCGMLVGYTVDCAELFDAHADGLHARTRYLSTRQHTAWTDLAVTLAGPYAEARFAKRDLLAVLKDGEKYEESDLRRAQREAQWLHRLALYRTPDHALLVAEQRAKAMLDEYWPIVEKTAHALYRQGRID
jgi:hypothetical protein